MSLKMKFHIFKVHTKRISNLNESRRVLGLFLEACGEPILRDQTALEHLSEDHQRTTKKVFNKCIQLFLKMTNINRKANKVSDSYLSLPLSNFPSLTFPLPPSLLTLSLSLSPSLQYEATHQRSQPPERVRQPRGRRPWPERWPRAGWP